jgi:hypothetical protein
MVLGDFIDEGRNRLFDRVAQAQRDECSHSLRQRVQR